MNRRPVHVRGGALHCSAGNDLKVVADSLFDHPTPPQHRSFQTQLGHLRVPYRPLPSNVDPVAESICVARQAMDQSELPSGTRTGLFVGSSSGLLGRQERELKAEIDHHAPTLPLRVPFVGELSRQLWLGLGIEGPRHYFSTACSASANALLYAAWMIAESRLDHALVVGAEFENQMSLLGFQGLGLTDPELCRPFDRDRRGVVLGEGVAAIALSHERGDACWKLLGGATLCDTSHPTSPSPERITQTVVQALDGASLQATALAAIKAHGTGTPSNDLAEGLGLRAAIGDHATPMTSIKSALGHTLGACGAIESLAFLKALERNQVPPTAGCQNPDPDLGIAPIRQATPFEPGPVLCNFFGFGGNNCALVFAPC